MNVAPEHFSDIQFKTASDGSVDIKCVVDKNKFCNAKFHETPSNSCQDVIVQLKARPTQEQYETVIEERDADRTDLEKCNTNNQSCKDSQIIGQCAPKVFFEKIPTHPTLSVRTTNIFKKVRILYIGELVQYTERELLRTPDFGRKSLDKIKEYLKSKGLRLGYVFKK